MPKKQIKLKPDKDYSSLSKRLSFFMSEGGVKQSHLANKLGVTPAAIHYLCNADVQNSKYTKQIAEILNVNEEWLATGKGSIYSMQEAGLHKVPIYYMDALMLSLKQKAKAPETHDFYYTPRAYAAGSFGIYVNDEEMAPKFEIGDIVVFEPSSLREDVLVLAYSSELPKLVIRQLYKSGDDDKYMLLAAQNKPISIDLTKQDKILGIYKECQKISRE